MSTNVDNNHHNGQQSSQSQGSQKTPRILACVLCQHRKIKCDRNTPCSNCLKANVPCTPSTPAPVRKRKRPNQDLQERLARCEALLKQYASTSGPLPPDVLSDNTKNDNAASAPQSGAVSSRPSAAASASPAGTETSLGPSGYDHLPRPPRTSSDESSKNFRPAGKLVVEDGSVKFMDSYIWSVIHENLQEMREILDADAMDEQSPFISDAPTPDDNVDLLLNDFSAIDLDDVVPAPVQIFRLWQVFLERVNPLTKLVHVPTLQPTVIEAAASHRNVAHNTQALLFAIYLLAAVSMTASESLQMLDMTRDEAIKKFTAGVKSSLTKLNFLKHYDLVTLQALVLYLISLQGRYDRHASWVLSGVVIRIAHKMGLHRDGDLLHLPPFEAEMRRRVWWQIIMLDGKYAMVSGFSDTLLPWGWDTKPPQNINDTNLFPGSTELQPREEPTEMVFCLMMYEVGLFMKDNRLVDVERVVWSNQNSEPGTQAYAESCSQLQRFKAMAEELDARLAALEERICDPSAGPIHAAAATLRPNIVSKFRDMLVPMRETPEWGTEVNNVHDNMFRVLLCHHETNLAAYELPANQNYLWFCKSHFHIDGMLFLVSHLHGRPQIGSFADRCWRVINLHYHHHEELWDMTQKQNLKLASLVLKSWRHRERALLQVCLPYDVPECVPRLQDVYPQSSSEVSSSGPSPAQPLKMGPPSGAMGSMGMSDPPLDFMGGFMDTSALDWSDMWTDLGNQPSANPQAATAAFGSFAHFGAPHNPGSGW